MLFRYRSLMTRTCIRAVCLMISSKMLNQCVQTVSTLSAPPPTAYHLSCFARSKKFPRARAREAPCFHFYINAWPWSLTDTQRERRWFVFHSRMMMSWHTSGAVAHTDETHAMSHETMLMFIIFLRERWVLLKLPRFDRDGVGEVK